jgi:hypothetical protein
MYDLKKKKLPRAKEIFNCLAGKLIAKDILKVKEHEDSDVEVIHPGRQMLTFYKFGKKQYMFELIRNESIYQGCWARMAPFLFSAGRYKLSTAIEPHIEKIVWCHTDGWVSNSQCHVTTGHEMGELKYEGYCKKVTIKNCTTPKIGDFIAPKN